jgi:hypothetical protein
LTIITPGRNEIAPFLLYISSYSSGMSSANVNPKKVQVLREIKKLINCLVNIKDETGEFLMTLEDGRVIDTKGWNDWEWTHGIGQI